MASEGPNSPDTAANVDEGGSNDWINPTRVVSSNNSHATCAIATLDPEGDSSDNLDVTDFDFAIPTGATIDGIVVEMERSKSPAGGGVDDLLIQIIKGGTAQGDDKAAFTWPNAASEAYATYGSSSDKWGVTWTADDINATDFGVRVRCISTTYDSVSVTAAVDHVRITVYYTPAGGGVQMIMMGVGF